MHIQQIHPWRSTVEEAIQIQESLQYQVITTDRLNTGIEYVAGLDMVFLEDGKTSCGAVAVLSFPQLQVV